LLHITIIYHIVNASLLSARRRSINNISIHLRMQFPLFSGILLLALALHDGVSAASPDDVKKPVDPCTIASSSGSFYDLRPLSVLLPAEGKKRGKNDKTDSWHARGYDYKSNFTLNICAPVVEDVEHVVGIGKSEWKNVSAFYEFEDKTYSLG
jgi:cation-dependent mannose-6-phosphate receptor